MRKQLWQFAVLRPGTLVPVVLGVWMVFGRAWIGPGLGLIVYGIYQAWKLINRTPQAAERLILRKEKQRRGINRNLHAEEKKALFKLLKYTKKLEKLGGDPNLGQDLMSKAWDIIEDNHKGIRKDELEALMASLPPLDKNQAGSSDDLMDRLRRECDMLYASQAEANASTQAKGW